MAKPKVVREGYYVAFCLSPSTAPDSWYNGLVKETDEYGARINQVRWDEKLDVITPSTEDFVVPWGNIDSMLVCTEEHPTRRFIRDRAPQWRTAIESMRKAEKTRAKKTPSE